MEFLTKRPLLSRIVLYTKYSSVKSFTNEFRLLDVPFSISQNCSIYLWNYSFIINNELHNDCKSYCVLYNEMLNLPATIHSNLIFCKIGLLGSNKNLSIYWKFQNSPALIIMSILLDLWSADLWILIIINFSFNQNNVFGIFPIMFDKIKQKIVLRKHISTLILNTCCVVFRIWNLQFSQYMYLIWYKLNQVFLPVYGHYIFHKNLSMRRYYISIIRRYF